MSLEASLSGVGLTANLGTASSSINVPIWQLSNILDGIRRIPAFFRRVDPLEPSSPASMLKRFIIASAPDTHGKFEELTRFETFINLIKTDSSIPGIPKTMVRALMVQGDVIVEQDTKAGALSLFSDFATIGADYGVDLLACFDNHDSNSRYSNTTAIVLSKAEQRAALIDPIISSVDSIVADVGNADACYYYKDYDGGDGYKMRVIVLDQYDMPQNVIGDSYEYTMYVGRNYSQAQLTWLAETALAVPSEDYHVIFFCGGSLSNPATFNTSHTAVLQLVDAFTQQGSVDLDDATADFEFDIDVDFSVINGFNGSVVGWFRGDGHILNAATYAINGRDYNTISCPSADQQSIGYGRQPETGVTDMMTFIVVDTEDRNIFLLRYGCPCSESGDELPYGDLGIDPVITY